MVPSGSGNWWLLIPLGQQQQGRVVLLLCPPPLLLVTLAAKLLKLAWVLSHMEGRILKPLFYRFPETHCKGLRQSLETVHLPGAFDPSMVAPAFPQPTSS